MKITKLILKNFSAVDNAMNAAHIELDLSKTENKICLLVGPNGSGKTTILGLLTPFADYGNLDVRNGNSLILKNKEGYKEIHIQKDNDMYVIKHFYTPQKNKNHSVKSYIEKNGVELNVNGNVTSFKEFVKMELQIEPEYLKLIRLGSNVTSLIGLTSTERKNFMGKIMDDIGIYLEYYKAVNLKLRQLDNMISHNIDKINRLGILDKKEFKKEIVTLENDISQIESLYMKESNQLAIYNDTIHKIDDVEHLSDNVKSISKKYKKMVDILEKKDQIESLDVNYYKKKIEVLNNTISTSEVERSSNIILIQNSLEHLNTQQEQIRAYQVQLQKEIESDKEIIRMDDNAKKLRLRLRELEDLIGEYHPSYTKKELEDFIIAVKNIQQVLNRTYEFGKLPVSKVVGLMKEKKNVMNYINRHLIDLDETKDDSASLFLSTIANRFMIGKENQVTIACKEECQAKALFYQIQTLLENAEVDDKNENASFYHDMEFVYQNLLAILPKFTDFKEIINVLPSDIQEYFMMDTMYDNISNLKLIYPEKAFNQLLGLATEYDTYLSVLDDYNKEEDMIQRFAGLSNSESLQDQITILEKSVEKLRNKIFEYKERNIALNEIISDSHKSLEVYEEIAETLERHDEVKELYEKYTAEYVLYTETYEKMNQSSLQISKYKYNMDMMKESLQKKIIDLDQFDRMNKELERLNFTYDEMTLTKESLTSKEGIPLRIMDRYLDNTVEITNELLDIAYDGRIYLDQFSITPNEFGMPFYNRGVRLEDVRLASQGELSFLSIALSFALSTQALSKYNIMLLDEIDGPLDSANREKFIQILENQIERIESEQNFLISHNSMFTSYPVDVIDMTGTHNNDAYTLANFIPIKKIA